MAKRRIKIGLVDADLLSNGTRHPNLVLMKLAGFLHDNEVDFKLIIDQDEDISQYKFIFCGVVRQEASDAPLFSDRAQSEAGVPLCRRQWLDRKESCGSGDYVCAVQSTQCDIPPECPLSGMVSQPDDKVK